MRVVSVTIQWSPDAYTLTTLGREATEGYDVEIADVSSAEQLQAKVFVSTAIDPVTRVAIPALRQPLDGDPLLRVRSVEPVRRTLTLWTVIVRYGTAQRGEPDDVSGGGGGAERPEIEWGWTERRELIDEDVNGNPLLNTVGEPFTLEESFYDRTLTITRNEPLEGLPGVENVGDYQDTVSATEFYGYRRGEAHMRQAGGGRLRRAGSLLQWRRTYQIVFRIGGWRRRWLNKGTRMPAAAGPGYVGISDGNGGVVTQPVPLTRTGFPITERPDQGGQQDTHWIDVQTKPHADWTPLRLESGIVATGR